LKIPHGEDLAALSGLWPVFLSYILSFVYVGIYWNNHHHLMHTVTKVSAGVLWANMHLLFWLSLMPFATAWLGEMHFASAPTALFGFALLMPAIAYSILVRTIIANEGPGSTLSRAIGADSKGWISIACYVAGIVLAFVAPWLSNALYVVVALIWLIPDRRIEKVLHQP
jgi:uncharacterized membrane protein